MQNENRKIEFRTAGDVCVDVQARAQNARRKKLGTVPIDRGGSLVGKRVGGVEVVAYCNGGTYKLKCHHCGEIWRLAYNSIWRTINRGGNFVCGSCKTIIGLTVRGMTILARSQTTHPNDTLWEVECHRKHKHTVARRTLFYKSDAPIYCGDCDDAIGKRFGKLTVVGLVPFITVCDCGKKRHYERRAVMSGKYQSCGTAGCKPGTSHGLSKKTKAYARWSKMLHRCRIGYSTVCDEWRRFETFFADMGEPPPFTVLDRIDNSRGYERSNCRWASFKLSTENRRNTIWINIGGRKKRVKDVANETGITESAIYQRILRGWSDKQTISTPMPSRRKNNLTIRNR